MIQKDKNLIANDSLNIGLLFSFEKKPLLDTNDDLPFWDDDHISQQMLNAHLNPDWDAASYNHKTIDRIVEWQVNYLNAKKGTRILDLGCGPGLYSTRFYQHGLDVVAMDYSRNSIRYAKNYADNNGLNIQYVYQDYLTMEYTEEFDVIFLIYCDFGALPDHKRDLLLQKIHKALKPNGLFVFDVFTRSNWEQQANRNWYMSESGFWRPDPHLVLEQTFHYEEENVFLKQYIIIDNNGEVSTYNLKDHYYSKSSITQLMKQHGYSVENVWSDLAGKAYEDNSKCLGLAVKKVNS